MTHGSSAGRSGWRAQDRPGNEIEAFGYHWRLRRLSALVNASPHLSLAELAKELGLESNYLSAFFRQKTGMRFSEWLSRVRVEHAVIVLRQDSPMTTVAHVAGFGSVRTLERNFKRVTGETPREYRSRWRSRPS